MSRIQKKCIIASTGFHLFLLLLLFVGPGFFTSSPKMDDAMVLTFVPLATTDAKIAGGGTPKGSPPPAASMNQPKAQPPAPAVPQKLERRKATEPDKSAIDPVEPARAKIKPNLKLVPRKSGPTAKPNTTRTQSSDQAPSKDLQALKSTVSSLRQGLSSSTAIEEMPAGPRGGGVPYANFYDGVKKIYSDAWLLPDGVTDDSATVTASVTIARNGEVLDAKIVVRSGNTQVDETVAATLRRVRFAVPLPASAKEDQRTVRIKFNVRAQRLIG